MPENDSILAKEDWIDSYLNKKDIVRKFEIIPHPKPKIKQSHQKLPNTNSVIFFLLKVSYP